MGGCILGGFGWVGGVPLRVDSTKQHATNPWRGEGREREGGGATTTPRDVCSSPPPSLPQGPLLERRGGPQEGDRARWILCGTHTHLLAYPTPSHRPYHPPLSLSGPTPPLPPILPKKIPPAVRNSMHCRRPAGLCVDCSCLGCCCLRGGGGRSVRSAARLATSETCPPTNREGGGGWGVELAWFVAPPGGLRWPLSSVNLRQFSANSTGNSPKCTDGHPVAKTPPVIFLFCWRGRC